MSSLVPRPFRLIAHNGRVWDPDPDPDPGNRNQTKYEGSLSEGQRLWKDDMYMYTYMYVRHSVSLALRRDGWSASSVPFSGRICKFRV